MCKRSNMGVAPDFACGLNPIVPPSYQSVAVGVDSDRSSDRPPHRTPRRYGRSSINRPIGSKCTPPEQFHPGYYVAVYRRDGFGFLEGL